MTVIKIQLKSDLRRVTVDTLPGYDELVGLCKSLFGLALPNQFALKYKDEEGDVISVTSERELCEAFVVMKGQIARFTIEEVQAPASDKKTNDPNTIELDIDMGANLGETIQNLIQNFQGAYARRYNPNNNSNAEVHHGVTCDGCKTYPITGSRFKCTTCPDYDLCASCNSQGKHKEHTLNKVEVSAPFRHCPWSRAGGVFHGAICDNCNTRIQGIRYKCQTCEDYDLCEKCEKLSVHKEHTFTQITRPCWSPRRSSPCQKKNDIPIRVDKEEKPQSPAIPLRIVKTEVAAPEAKAEEVKEVAPVEIKEVAPVEVKEEVKPVEVAAPVFAKPVPLRIVKEVVPVQEEAKPEVAKNPFADKLEQLKAMGFVDEERNIALLVKHKGDLVKTVSDLLL